MRTPKERILQRVYPTRQARREDYGLTGVIADVLHVLVGRRPAQYWSDATGHIGGIQDHQCDFRLRGTARRVSLLIRTAHPKPTDVTARALCAHLHLIRAQFRTIPLNSA